MPLFMLLLKCINPIVVWTLREICERVRLKLVRDILVFCLLYILYFWIGVEGINIRDYLSQTHVTQD